MVRALLMTVVLVVGLSMASVAEAGWRHRHCGHQSYSGCAQSHHGSYRHRGCYNNSYGGCHQNSWNQCGGQSYQRPSSHCSGGVCW
ncbi:hypothetical protein [Bremerella alba]|uniref:Uncharacterized protein n=1 Tax=Bremerella alba TaxID=980252 RepID=A0A7V9A5S0_9BACT|nr:hypothetical protein [Bremerella alba]MBA2113181.1 hypothetical protein [Bremerella alba]